MHKRPGKLALRNAERARLIWRLLVSDRDGHVSRARAMCRRSIVAIFAEVSGRGGRAVPQSRGGMLSTTCDIML
jgi:hypothetical protein